jgi:hypothetical protein
MVLTQVSNPNNPYLNRQKSSFFIPLHPNPLPQGERELYNYAPLLMGSIPIPHPPLMGGVGESDCLTQITQESYRNIYRLSF